MFGAAKKIGHNLFGGLFDGRPGAFSQHGGGQALPADPWQAMLALGENPHAGPPAKRIPQVQKPDDGVSKWGVARDVFFEGLSPHDARLRRQQRALAERMYSDPSLSDEQRYLAMVDTPGFVQGRVAQRATGEALKGALAGFGLGPQVPQAPAAGDAPPVAKRVPQVQQAQAPVPSPEDMRARLAGSLDGVGFSSGLRSEEDNRRVGGVPNSYHLSGQAWDLTPKPGETMAQLEARVSGLGLPFSEIINEGDHVHVAWGDNPRERDGSLKRVPQVAQAAGEVSQDVAAVEPQAQPQPFAGMPIPPTPQELAFLQSAVDGPPAMQKQALDLLGKIQSRNMGPQQYEITTTPQGQLIRTPKFGTGDPIVSAIPGFERPAGEGFVRTGPTSVVPETGGKQDPNSPMNRLEGLSKFRAEIKTVKDEATKLRRSYDVARAGFAQQNGAGDIASINGFQKLIDDGVVREGDVDLQLKSNGIDGTWAKIAGTAKSTGYLSPEIRVKLRGATEAIYAKVNETYRKRVMGMRGTVERAYGPGAFEDVMPADEVEAYGWDLPERPKGTKQATEEQWRAAQRFAGSKAAPGTEGNPYVPDTRAEFDKLAPGAWYVASDGSVGQKKPPAKAKPEQPLSREAKIAAAKAAAAKARSAR